MLVSIVIPARNEEATLGRVLADIQRTAPELKDCELELICVDDHSTDRTREIAESYGAKVVSNQKRPGKGMALRTGFEAARGDVIIMLDADYSHRAEDLPLFLDQINRGAGLVIGSRLYGGSDEYTLVRAFGNLVLTFCCGILLGRYLSDALNGYKAFRRDVFTDFKYRSKSFDIEIELVANALRKQYKVVEINSHERARAGGEAKSKVVRHGSLIFARILKEYLKGI